ncbi:MAG TPA: helix-turn-helix transcriptional regulator [Steroidobacteraceae bacterium]
MKLNSATVKRLREAKSWTQEHLASAAGVSLRTVQRLEADGSASAESRLAIAAALGVPVDSIHLAPDSVESASAAELRRVAVGTRWGYTGVAIGTLASAAGIVSGSASPEQAATALGILGAFAGITAGAIGVLAQRAVRLASDS